MRETFKASEGEAAFDDEDLMERLNRYACRKRPTKENLRDRILELAHKELIQRPQYIDCWHVLLGKNCQKTDRSTAAKVYEQYESLEPTTKKVLVWWRQCPAAIVNARHWNTSRNSSEAWISRNLRTFVLIVCAQHCCAGNATVICHASLHVLVTIDWS